MTSTHWSFASNESKLEVKKLTLNIDLQLQDELLLVLVGPLIPPESIFEVGLNF